jgi:hypothetical protein
MKNTNQSARQAVRTYSSITRVVAAVIAMMLIMVASTFAAVHSDAPSGLPFAVASYAAATTTSMPLNGAELKLENSSPKDGSKNMPMENVGIKLYFSENVTDDSVWEVNQKAFSFQDKKGKKIKTTAYRDPKKKDTNYILVTASPKGNKLASNSKYKLVIDKGILGKDGAMLEADKVIDFQTINMEGTTKVNMFMMVGMVAIVIGLNAFTSWRKKRKEAEAGDVPEEKEKKVDVYKMAKEQGITVEEASAILEKERAKKAKKREKALKAAEQAKRDAAKNAATQATQAKQLERPKQVYRVSKKQPIKKSK